MTLHRSRTGRWWIKADLPDCKWCGPYKTKREAEDDRRGMLRTLRGE